MNRLILWPKSLAIAFAAATLLPGCTIWLKPSESQVPLAPVDYSDPVLNQRRVFVVGGITQESAARTIQQLLYLDALADSPIELEIMTPGGDLNAAFAVERVLRRLRSSVHTRALGECNSGGALLLAAGTGTREAPDDAVIVIHGLEVHGEPPARYEELVQAAYTNFWRRCARLPEAWLPLPPGKLFVLSAQEALGYGIIDRVIPTKGP